MKEKFNRIKQGFKEWFRAKFLADGVDPIEARKKQWRLGIIIVGFILAIVILANLGNSRVNNSSKAKASQSAKTKSNAIGNLKQGVKNETIWVETGQKSIKEMKGKQDKAEQDFKEYKIHVDKDKISKENFVKALQEMRAKMEEDFSKKLEKILEGIQANSGQVNGQNFSIGINDFRKKKKKKFKKFGDYIPANSYVRAKIIEGVDQSVGTKAAADPKSVLLSLTGDVISAGFKGKYLKSDVLKGCKLSCSTKGEISSEKVYGSLVKLTCATSPTDVVEMFVKGYIAAKGKGGIRGEISNHNFDLLQKAFFANFIGVLGGVANQYGQGTQTFGNGFMFSNQNSIENILTRGVGRGLGSSADRLSNYLIGVAEQYQPVISVDNGIEVTVVFQEGFSLSEEED
ncbi:MAG: hypothetical protein HRU36_03055 [Rickettsiales bacterium]|nr:hypothetical protein [Rickettsiales bacterium]